jgi:ubiquinone/menaquinone biosynthesis C-methylase UbiE
VTATRPYDASEYHTDIDSEVRRLRHMANLNWAKESRTLQAFGLTDGMSVLELASGPGFITELLSTIVPNGSITGVEIDPKLIAYAEGYLPDRAASPYQFVERSVLDTGLPDNSFDFAVARLIFEHLTDQDLAMREIFRVLKPGGRLVIIDFDYRFSHLTTPVVTQAEAALEKAAAVHAARGGDPTAGRRVWRLLRDAGFSDIDLEAIVLHSGEKGMAWSAVQFDPSRLLPFVAAGVLSQQEWNEVKEAMDRFVADEQSFYMSILILGLGIKPTEG